MHIPFCKSKCAYCNFNSIQDLSDLDAYIGALCREIALRGEQLRDAAVDTVYFGGGTPSVLPPQLFSMIVQCVNTHFHLQLKEFTVECNPESISKDKLLCYRDCGVNRISLGAQSFEDDVLSSIGRLHNAEQAENAVAIAREHFNNVSVDFILGLPGQTARDVHKLARVVKAYKLPHVSAYGLKLEEGTPLFDRLRGQTDDDAAADYYDAVCGALGTLGLSRYEVSNFAVSGKESLHNLKYWQLEEYLGMGVSAHSYLGGERFSNTDSIAEYVEKLRTGILPECAREKISLKESMFEYVMLALRTEQGIDLDAFQSKFGLDFFTVYHENIQKCYDNLRIYDKKIKIKPDKYYIMNEILINFL